MNLFSVFDIPRRQKANLDLSENFLYIEWPHMSILQQWDKRIFYNWDKVKEVSIQCKKKWFGEDVIIHIKTDESDKYPAQNFYFRVKDESLAEDIRAAIKQNSIDYEKVLHAREEKRKLQEELIRQKKAREEELQQLLIARYKTGDFDGVSPNEFEEIVGRLFSSMGYFVKSVGGTGDEGIDLVCTNKATHEKIVIQCKRYRSKIGAPIVRDFYGALIHSKANKGFIITTSYYTESAMAWAKNKPIELVDKYRLKSLMTKYYK